MNEQQELAGVAEVLGTWKAAGRGVIAIDRFLSGRGRPTAEEVEYFELLDGLFAHAGRGAEKVEAKRVSLGSESVQDYSAFLDVVGALLASSAQREDASFGGLLKRLQDVAGAFASGKNPVESDARLLSQVLKSIATFQSQQVSSFFFAPSPALR